MKNSALRTVLFFVTIGFFLTSLPSCQDSPSHQLAPTNHVTTHITTITFADFSHQAGSYQPLIAAFQEEHPAIEVQFVSFDEQINDTHLDKRKIAAMADTAILYSPPTAVEQSLFLSLEPLIEQDPAFAKEDFWPNLLSACPAGLPATLSVGFIYYDRTAYAESGVPEPPLNWSWEEFAQTVQTLTDQSDTEINRYGFLPPVDSLVMLRPLLDGMSPASNEPADPQAISAAVEWYTELWNNGYLPDWTTTTSPHVQHRTLINGRKAAMWYGNLTEFVQYQNQFGSALGIIPFPVGERPTTPAQVTCAAISAGTAHPDAAWLWIKFLVDNMPAAIIPVRPGLAEATDYWHRFNEQAAAAIHTALDHAWYSSQHPEQLAVIIEAWQNALAEKTSVSTMLANLEQIPTPTIPATLEPVAVIPPPPPDAETSITVDYFSTAGGQYLPALESLVEEFHRLYPDIQVRLHTTIPGAQAGMVFRPTDIAETFDCYTIQNSTSLAAYGDDLFYPLGPLLALEETMWMNDIPPELWDAFRVKEQLYGLPAASQPSLIYYNVDLLKQLDLSPPAWDWTPEDLWFLASTAAHHEEASYGLIPFQSIPANGYGILLPLYGVLLSDLIDVEDMPIARLDDSNLLAGLDWIASLTDEGVIPYLGFDSSEPIPYHRWEAEVLAGRVLLWTAPIYGAEFEVGVVPPPVASKPLPLWNVAAYVISRRTATPYGCWEWIKFLSAQPHVLPGVPARASVANAAAWKTSVGEELASAYLVALSRSQFQPVFDRAVQSPERPLLVWLENALIEASTPGSDPARLLDAAQVKADVYVTCLGSLFDITDEMINNCAQEADPSYVPVNPGD